MKKLFNSVKPVHAVTSI